LSDDGWYGDPQEPGPDPAYGRGRRATQGRPPQPEQSGQYAQQYPQDPYQSNQYPQDYAAQPQQSYYDELGPRTTGQDWNTAERNAAQDWHSSQQGYTTPQTYPQQSQQPQPSYPRHRQPQAQPQPQQAYPADPYASGSHASGSYGTGSYASDGYAQPAAPPPDPYASGSYTTDPYGSGTYGRPARGTNGGGYGDPGYSSGGYPTANPAVPGRGPANPQAQPQGQPQESYGRRRAAGPPSGTPNGYTQYQDDDDEFPTSAGRRTSGYGGEPDTRAVNPSTAPRSRRRAVSSQDDDDREDRFKLIDDDEGDEDAGSGRGRKPRQKRGRNCLAVFIAFSVIAGGLGYGGYKGVQWYQSKYGPAPDFVSTTGSGTKVPINIPSGSGGRTIGGLLFNAGVIKSQRAFTDACNANPKCASIEAGTYLLPTGISAATSITDLLDPKNKDSKSQLITYGGERAAQIFASLESKTGWSDADIRAAVASNKIDLPAWDTAQPGPKFPYAHIEGFIASESYVLTDYKTPTALLKKMVDDQLAVFTEEDLANKAAGLGVTEYKLLIIASLARAEAGSNTSDLNKIAGVVFNRFNNPMQFAHLGFDTATLYGMGNTGTVPNNKDTTNPYNTSVFGIKGLPPGPIDNPDQPAIDAAVNPNRANNYFYFCATPDGVQYASNNTQWQALGVKYKGLCGSSG
jgi:UPF0755 protein